MFTAGLGRWLSRSDLVLGSKTPVQRCPVPGCYIRSTLEADLPGRDRGRMEPNEPPVRSECGQNCAPAFQQTDKPRRSGCPTPY